MFKFFIDTNVIIDGLTQRDLSYQQSRNLFAILHLEKLRGI